MSLLLIMLLQPKTPLLLNKLELHIPSSYLEVPTSMSSGHSTFSYISSI